MVRGLIPVGAVGWRGCAQGLVRKGTGWWVEPGLSPFLFWQGSFRSLMESPPERVEKRAQRGDSGRSQWDSFKCAPGTTLPCSLSFLLTGVEIGLGQMTHSRAQSWKVTNWVWGTWPSWPLGHCADFRILGNCPVDSWPERVWMSAGRDPALQPSENVNG